MSYLIKEMNEEERPRERFKKYGVEALSNEELLSILMRTGTRDKSVKELSLDLMGEIKIHDFSKMNYNALKKIKGIGEVKAITILSAIEFGKRVMSKSYLTTTIRCGEDVFNLVKEEMGYEIQEKFMAIFLDTKKKVIDKKVLFIGTVNNSDITPRDVFREAVRCNAVGIILVHNHPAGSIEPSYDDTYLTGEFIKLGRMMGISVLDHIIVSKDNYYSFRANNEEMFSVLLTNKDV